MSRGPIQRRAMTPDEITIARALCPSRVKFIPASTEKRFAFSLAAEAEMSTPMITPRQAEYLLTLCIRMRRQVPADVLSIAERLSGRPLPPTRRRATAGVAVALLTLAYVAGCSSCWQRPGCKAPPPAPAPKDTVPR